MRAVRHTVGWLVAAAVLGTLALLGWAMLRGRPQDLPWTPLDLSQPVGALTGRKLTGLVGEGAQCRALLTQAGVRFTALPPRRQGDGCGYDDAVRLGRGGALDLRLSPASVGMACPVAASVAMWDWNVVQPAARAEFGSAVVQVDHLGSYSCRRINNREGGSWSEHAGANALDIAGFRLADGRRISVLRDWDGDDAEARFLRRVRDGACDLFATTLSPDYNAAHRDHFHLDQAARGAMGWRACR